MKPNFIIGGIAKNGTSYLYNLLKNHPKIDMPKRSMDYSFFDNDDIYENGFEWYETIFNKLDENKLIGQVSADCAFNPGSIEKIKKHLPNVKLIFIFRNPVESIYSLYWHQMKTARECFSFEKSLELEQKRIKKSYYDFRMYSYTGRYKFSNQVKRIKENFDDSQVMFIPFEVFVKNELRILNLIFSFLGVDQIEDINLLKIDLANTNKAKIPTNSFVLKISFYLRKWKLDNLALFFLNKYLVEDVPPPMLKNTRIMLEKDFIEDMNFHRALVNKYEKAS